MNMAFRLILVVVLVLTLPGCAPSTKAIMQAESSALELRSFQQRAFDTADLEKTLRTVIATLQDLGFVVDKADLDLGTVSATKLAGYQLRITVTVRPRGTTQVLVRANAQYLDKAVEDPKPYQDFFAALEKSMFLTAQQVD
jgi:ABC-type glycerol-3-phosphate transport system substrate-binding protein